MLGRFAFATFQINSNCLLRIPNSTQTSFLSSRRSFFVSTFKMSEEKSAGGQKQRHPDVNSALHVIKGAIVKVFHTPITTSTEAHKKGEGRLTVEYPHPKAPTQDEINKIEELCNMKIKENVEILHFSMPRTEAEEKYRKTPVNETFIYDKFPVKPEITELKIVEIPEWNVNCSAGPLVKRTGDIKPMKLLRTNFRDQKKECEFVFALLDSLEPAAAPSGGKKGNKAETQSSTSTSQQVKGESDDIQFVSQQLLDEILEEFKKHGVTIPQEKSQALSDEIKEKIAHKVNIVKNTAYTKGFNAKTQ